MSGLLAAMAAFVFAAFALAVRCHFRPGAMAPGMLAISAIGVLALAAVLRDLWRTPPASGPALAALGLMAASLALFLWAVAASRAARLALAFTPEAPATLLRDGPYRLVRHPFYTSYGLYWLGCAVAAPTLPVLAGAAAMIALYVAAQRREEARFLASPLAEDYRAYRRETGAFLPRPARLRSRT